MNDKQWQAFKTETKPYIEMVCNKGHKNETIVFWNGAGIMKYDSFEYSRKILQQIVKPIPLVDGPSFNFNSKIIGYEWPLKSKLKI